MKISSFFNINKSNQPAEGLQKNQAPLTSGKTIEAGSNEVVEPTKDFVKNTEGQSLSTLEKATEIYRSNGVEPNSKIITETKKFLDKVQGNEKDKLFTIEMAAAKGIDPTEKNLTAMHAALNDEAVSTQTVETLMPETKTVEETVKVLRKIEGQLKGVHSATREELKRTFEALGLSKDDVTAACDLVEEGLALNQSPSEILSALAKQFPKEPFQGMFELASKWSAEVKGAVNVKDIVNLKDLMKAVLPEVKQVALVFSDATDKDLYQSVSKNTGVEGTFEEMRLDRSSIEMAVDSEIDLDLESGEAPDLNFEKNEAAFLDDIDPFLDSLEMMVEQVLNQTAANYGAHDLQNYFSSENTKAYLVKEVTLKMIEVKQTFDHFQAGTLKSLEAVIAKSETVKISGEELSQLVSGTAQKLDHLIMKTDLTLYTDMKSEKKLVGLSSDLQQIQTLALKDSTKAMHLLKEVHQKIEALVFQPSKEKVNVYMTQKAEAVMGENALTNALERTKASGGARMLMEVMRQMGVNHEPELLEQMLSSSKQDGTLSNEKESLKSMLLKLESEAQSDPKTVKNIEKALLNLTGQQLLSKQESSKDSQTLFFSLPMGANGQDAKLYIKSRNKQGGLDWENCTAFVMIDSERFGPTGIRLNITDRYLNMSVISESDTLETIMKPLTEQFVVDLKEIGYLPNEVKFLKSSPKEEGSKVLKSGVEPAPSLDKSPDDAEQRGKGFELRI